MKKTGPLLCFLVLLAFIACKTEKAKVDYRLSPDQMIRLMYDVQWSDAAMANLSKPRQDSLRTLFWGKLTTIYGLSEAEIQEEIHKLQGDPDFMKIVFDSIKVMSDTIK